MKKIITCHLIFLLILFFSCQKQDQQKINVVLNAPEKTVPVLNAFNNSLDFSNPQTLEFDFGSLPIPSDSSLEIEYAFSFPPSDYIKNNYALTLETNTASWTLPMDFLFLGVPSSDNAAFHYAVPLDDGSNGKFSITLTANAANTNAARTSTEQMPVFEVRSLRCTDQWFGLKSGEDGYYITPYVSKQSNGSFVINTRDIKRAASSQYELTAELGEKAAVAIDRRRVEAAPGIKNIFIPSSLISHNASVTFSGDRIISFKLSPSDIPAFPSPVTADPGLILDWPLEKWRNNNWEIFRWEQFPSILIIDTADYEAQDRLLKRLAFFVEKAGFRGKLVHDEEVAELHGWNAHDYKAEDLARFFDTAAKTNFPLHEEDLLLKKILLNEGIIRQSADGIIPGNGAIISICRQSGTYMRKVYMAHEGFHGLLYLNKDFEDFSRSRWEQLNPQGRKVFLAYMEHKEYDILDDFLVVKEFKGHVLQMTVAGVKYYFGSTLPGFIEYTEFGAALPPKDRDSNSWPGIASIFERESQAFSAYVNRRWGFAAGRIWTLTVSSF